MKIILNSDDSNDKKIVKESLEQFTKEKLDIEMICKKPKKDLILCDKDLLQNLSDNSKLIYDYCVKNKIKYDFLVNFELGYYNYYNFYFNCCLSHVLCQLPNSQEYYTVGFGSGLKLDKPMVDFFKSGHFFHELKKSNIKKVDQDDISVALTNDMLTDSYYKSVSLTNAFAQLAAKNIYKEIDNQIELTLTKKI